jgi:mono/diheme cytochrome c family protein
MNHKIENFGLLAAAALAGGVMVMGGCRGERSNSPPRQFFPDMDDQPKWKPQSGSDFFADGRTMRQPVKGSVPFGAYEFVSDKEWAQPFMLKRETYLKEDAAKYQGTGADGDYLPVMPVQVTSAMLQRGQERFNIYCSACHGYTGDGKGMVGRGWSYPLPNFHDDKYKNRAEKTAKDGYIFHVARYGVIGPDGSQKMPGYAHALSESDAWAVVGYIRVLQESQAGVPLNEVPEAQRQMLQQRMVKPSTPAPAQAPAPAAAPASTPAPATAGGKS